MASAKELLERLTIREIVENWALLRDRAVVASESCGMRRPDDHRIEGSFEEFIKASQAGYDKASASCTSSADHHRPRSAIAPSSHRRSRRIHIQVTIFDGAVRRGLHLDASISSWRNAKAVGHRLGQPTLRIASIPFDPSATLKLDGELLARYPGDIATSPTSLVRAGQKVRTDVPG